MSVGGVCGVCGGAAKSMNTCELCGQTVCDQHFLAGEGVCIECASKRGL